MSTMRAVVQIDADPSGVVKGVAKANKALESLANGGALGTGGIGGMFGGPIAWLKILAEEIGKRSQELHALAVSSSPEAMNAAMMTEEAQSSANRKVGEALGPYVAAIERERAARIESAGARTAAGAQAIGDGMIFTDALGGTLATARESVVDSALGTLGDFDTPGPITSYMNATGTTDAIADSLVPILLSIDRRLGILGGGG